MGVSAGVLGGEVVRRLALLMKIRGLQCGGHQVQLLGLVRPVLAARPKLASLQITAADGRLRRVAIRRDFRGRHEHA